MQNPSLGIAAQKLGSYEESYMPCIWRAKGTVQNPFCVIIISKLRHHLTRKQNVDNSITCLKEMKNNKETGSLISKTIRRPWPEL